MFRTWTNSSLSSISSSSRPPLSKLRRPSAGMVLLTATRSYRKILSSNVCVKSKWAHRKLVDGQPRRIFFHSQSARCFPPLSQSCGTVKFYDSESGDPTIPPWPSRSEDEDPTILASSSISKEERKFLRSIVDRLRALAKKLWEAWLVTFRSAEIAIRMSPLLVLTPAAMVAAQFYKDENEQKDNPMSQLSWWYAMKQLQALGPAFVKLAQWIATRRDIFPRNVCNQFSKLHDRGFTHSWSHTHKALSQAFGAEYEERGLQIDRDNLLGCGSAAQVYRGTLTSKDASGKKTRRAVAVKVLHPRFKEMVDRDLNLMESFANMLHSKPFGEQMRWLNLPHATQNFGSILRRQADLRVEGQNLANFRQNFYGGKDAEEEEKLSSISFPCPVDGWIHERVLVQEFIQDSTSIGDFLYNETEHGLAVRRELAGTLFRAFLKMIFLDNFVHCDLHPGNVLVQTRLVPASSSIASKLTLAQGSKPELNGRYQYKIVLIDAGIATSLNSNDQRNLKDLFRAVILNDGNQAGRLMVQRAKYERCSEKEGGVESFAKGVEDIVSEFHDRRSQGLTLGAVRIGNLLSRVLDLCRVYGVEVDPAMASIVISTLVLEGLGRSLHPDLNLMDFAVPFVLGRGKV